MSVGTDIKSMSACARDLQEKWAGWCRGGARKEANELPDLGKRSRKKNGGKAPGKGSKKRGRGAGRAGEGPSDGGEVPEQLRGWRRRWDVNDGEGYGVSERVNKGRNE